MSLYPGNPEPVQLSIVVVNFNTWHLTMECIRTIYYHALPFKFEVILVDNGSDEDRKNEVTGEFPGLRFLNTGENVGFARANNIGIQKSSGKYIALINSDAFLIDDSLSRLVDFLDSNPEVGVVGPRHFDGNMNFQLSCGDFPNLFTEILRKVWTYRLSINDYWVRDYLDVKHSELSRVDWVSGSCMVLRREALSKSKLFDERFFMYFEDIDLCRRIMSQNYIVHYLYDTTIIHFGGSSAKLNLMKVLTEYRRSQIYFTRKFYGRSGELFIRALLVFKSLVHLFFSVFPFAVHKLIRRDTRKSFAKLLLCKKILFIAIHPIQVEPRVPAIQAPQLSRRKSESPVCRPV